MLAMALSCSLALLGQTAGGEAGADEVKADYQHQVASADRSATAQVRLALWCEAHGLSEERVEHLARALLSDPTNAVARGLLGWVADAGKWRKPEDVTRRVQADAGLSAALAEYNARRDRTPDTADAQWRLAAWCETKGLKAEADVHLAAVIRKDPQRQAAWRKLGYRKQKNGHWATEEQVAEARAEAEAQKHADRYWEAALTKLRRYLAIPGQREQARAELLSLSDPRAVPSLVRVFGKGVADQRVVVQLLGQVDSPRASRVLALLGVIGAGDDVRRLAKETLRLRDPRDYGEILLGLIQTPIEYEVRPVGGPGSPGTLYIEGKAYNLQRIYAPPPPPEFVPPAGSFLTADAQGLPALSIPMGEVSRGINRRQASDLADAIDSGRSPDRLVMEKIGIKSAGVFIGKDLANGIRSALATNPLYDNVEFGRPVREIIPIGQMLLEVQKSAIVAEKQLAADVFAINAQNAAIRRENEQVLDVLNAATGQRLADDTKALTIWWAKQQGMSLMDPHAAKPVPTYVEEVPIVYQPRPLPSTMTIGGINSISLQHSCFGAGTPVQTREGTRPIETLRAGDQVLTQDPDTGKLDFRPILVVYHNPPAETLHLSLSRDSIVVTPIHRFWKPGRGWTMARDLQVGDTVRVLGGVARVESVEEDRVQPVFNLQVSGSPSFFAGSSAALVHDNSPVEATPQPFDAVPVVASSR